VPLVPTLRAVASRQNGLFTTAQALEAGYSKAEIAAAIRTRLWTRLRRGVLITTAQHHSFDSRGQHIAQLRAILLNTSGPTFASHLSATVVHCLPLLDRRVVVTVTHPGAAHSKLRDGAKHYTSRVDAHEHTLVDGLPTLTIARTVADVARTASFEQAVVIADAALRTGLSRDELDAMAASCAQWPGARRLTRVVAFARGESESVGESISRILFAAQGLPPPLLQVNVYDADGLIGRADFLWEKYMTIVEFDGRVKYAGAGPDVLYKEKRREDRLRDAGYEVVRITWNDVWERPEWVAAKIRAAFARHLKHANERSAR
jgi:hypothetical protein